MTSRVPPAVSAFLSGAKSGKSQRISKPVSDYMAALGKKGGEAATGVKKRRSAAHYKRLAEIRRKN